MPWFIGLINGGVTGCVPFTFTDDFERAGPGLGSAWMESDVLWPYPIFSAVSAPFTIDSGAAVTVCELDRFPTFTIGSMVTTATNSTGIGQFIEINMTNFFQLLEDPLNFRSYVQLVNFLDPVTGNGRFASMRIDSGVGFIGMEKVALDWTTFTGVDGSTATDLQDSIIYPYLDGATDITLRLESRDNGQQTLYYNGTPILDTSAVTAVGSGTHQAITMWWDVQFAPDCTDATSPRINSVTLGNLCDTHTVTVFFYGFDTSSNTNNDFDQSFVVPAGVTSLDVLLNGSASWSATSSAGAAKRYGVTIPVTPGETLTLKVGNIPASSNSAGTAGGWPDGGDGGTNTFITPDGLGGGGSTSIWRGGTLIAIAGGGGGLPNNLTVPLNAYGGGIGGDDFATGAGTDGVSPGVTVASRQGGFGGTQLAGGAGGPRLSRTPSSLPNPATDTVAGGAGSSLQGGDGASDLTDSTFLAGSGGGGGYFGGGGGSKRKQPVDASGNSAGSGGGGGSSWYDTGLATGAIDDGTLSTSFGFVSITYTPA